VRGIACRQFDGRAQSLPTATIQTPLTRPHVPVDRHHRGNHAPRALGQASKWKRREATAHAARRDPTTSDPTEGNSRRSKNPKVPAPIQSHPKSHASKVSEIRHPIRPPCHGYDGPAPLAQDSIHAQCLASQPEATYECKTMMLGWVLELASARGIRRKKGPCVRARMGRMGA
jgi:hypothetical protein